MSAPLLRNYRDRPQSLFSARTTKGHVRSSVIYVGPGEVESVVTDRTPVLRVCVNLIMLTDYRFKYFKSHRAHAAGDEESGNDCSNARD